jgi:phenylpyruvate tautomerase
MPLLKITTNNKIDNTENFALLASKTTAEILGKPESYVMVIVNDQQTLIFAGNDKPAAFIELKSLGLPETDTAKLSSALCSLISEQAAIDANRIYIEFCNAERHMWGWDGATF